jgi:hypothetical protein
MPYGISGDVLLEAAKRESGSKVPYGVIGGRSQPTKNDFVITQAASLRQVAVILQLKE